MSFDKRGNQYIVLQYGLTAKKQNKAKNKLQLHTKTGNKQMKQTSLRRPWKEMWAGDGGEARRFLGWVLASPMCTVNKLLAYMCYIILCI